MRIKGATTIIKKQCEFLGMTVAEVIKFADESPMAQPTSLLQAIKVFRQEMRRSEDFFENK